MTPSRTQNLNIPLQHIIMAPHAGSILKSSFLASGSTLCTLKNQSNMQNCGWRARSWMTTQIVLGEFMMFFMTLLTGYINVQGI